MTDTIAERKLAIAAEALRRITSKADCERFNRGYVPEWEWAEDALTKITALDAPPQPNLTGMRAADPKVRELREAARDVAGFTWPNENDAMRRLRAALAALDAEDRP